MDSIMGVKKKLSLAIEFLQLPQEVCPMLGSSEVLDDDVSSKRSALSTGAVRQDVGADVVGSFSRAGS